MEKEKFDVSVILPINSSMNKNFDELFDRAIKSLEIQNLGINELVIVHSGEDNLKSFLNKIKTLMNFLIQIFNCKKGF
jgi:hypothetical protein